MKRGVTLSTRPAAENANRRPKCKAKKDSSGVIICRGGPMAKSRIRGKNMRAHDQDNKLDQSSRLSDFLLNHPISRTSTNMPEAAQVHEAVVPSLRSSGFTGRESTEASVSELEDARRLLDKSSSSNVEDMRVQGSGVLETWPIILLRVMSWL